MPCISVPVYFWIQYTGLIVELRMDMKRIVVVLPLYGGSLPIGRYCAEALREIGCLVEVFESPSFYSAFSALQDLRVSTQQREFLENNFLQVMTHAICAKAEHFKADLVFCMAQAPLGRQGLKRLKKLGIPTAMWFVEDYQLFPYWRTLAPYYDVFAVIQKNPFLEELRAIGVENALYLPLAALPDFHKRQDLSPEEREEFEATVSFLGAGYPNRRRAFKELIQPGFKIWGTEWEDEPELAPYLQRDGARMSSEEAVKVYNASTININLHSSVVADVLVGKGDFVNPRTFELASSQVFQLVDQRGLMDELFGPDELARFTSLEDLREKIQYFLANPHERDAYIERAHQRVIQDHQYTHRMKTLLDFVEERVKDFCKEEEPAALTALPEEYHKELLNLLKKEKLPLHASFDDVVGCLQNKQERLSEMETAILFLWEWKLQYLK